MGCEVIGVIYLFLSLPPSFSTHQVRERVASSKGEGSRRLRGMQRQVGRR